MVLIAQTSSTQGTSYLHTDALGSVVATVGRVNAALSFTCPSSWTLSGNTPGSLCTQGTSGTSILSAAAARGHVKDQNSHDP